MGLFLLVGCQQQLVLEPRCSCADMTIVPYVGAGGSTVSLSLTPLTPEKYTVWAIKAEAILDAQGFWEVVSPTDDAVVDDKKNKMVRVQLFGAFSEDLLMQVS